MVHVEYARCKFGAGFDVFRNANSQELSALYRYDLNLADTAEVWRRGSGGSWLVDLTAGGSVAENLYA